MSYRDNSFHGLHDDITGKTNGVRSNRPFAYPGPTQRNLNKDGKFEESKVMQRGYIRSIPTKIYGIQQPVMKASFQFNPSTLQQSVQAQADTLDMIRQDPSQYSTPKPGNANLAFNLKFDRSHELNNYKENVDYSSENIWSWGPETVGVYHDIDALYRVIGQGAYTETHQYLKEVVRRRGILSLNDSTGSTVGDWAGGDAGGTDIQGDDDEGFTFDDSLKYLFGDEEIDGALFNNTAFLVPQPVRLVFSSLFVVEGHVMASNVTYSRWTPSLVPIMADVSLTIDAKDIGFSREKMLLTSALEVAAKNAEQEVQEQQDAQQEAVTEALSMIRSAKVGIIDLTERERGGSKDDSWGNTNTWKSGRGLGHVLWHLDNKSVDGSTEKYGPTWPHLYKSCYLTGQGDSHEKLKSYFEDDTIKSITMRYNVELYGPYKKDGANENRPVYQQTQAGGQVPLALVDPLKTATESIPLHGNGISTLFTEQYTNTVKATNWDQFQKFFNHKSYHVEGDSSNSSTDRLRDDAENWRDQQQAIIEGVNQVSRSGGVPKKGGAASNSGREMFPLISGRVNFGSGEKGEMDDDLKDEIYVYKWTIEGTVNFGEGEDIKADVATTKATQWGSGTVADLFDQEHQGTRANKTSQVGDRRFTLKSNITLDWVSTAATATVVDAAPTVPDDIPVRGLPAKSSGNLPRVEAKDGGYARPRSSGSTPRRRDKYLAGIDPNGAARADKRKKDTPGGTSSTNPNKGGNGPSFPI
jgi:hypothetical protein